MLFRSSTPGGSYARESADYANYMRLHMTQTGQSEQTTNAIEKQIFLRAPRARVWRALTDAREFGTWFGVSLDDPLEVGKWASGRITHPGYEHVRFQMLVERMRRRGRCFRQRRCRRSPAALGPHSPIAANCWVCQSVRSRGRTIDGAGWALNPYVRSRKDPVQQKLSVFCGAAERRPRTQRS